MTDQADTTDQNPDHARLHESRKRATALLKDANLARWHALLLRKRADDLTDEADQIEREALALAFPDGLPAGFYARCMDEAMR
ncbi:MAG: hypothetical protein IT371_30765 [Deltaproteobacteria bacterium]|nr:hypothetical protein [Deltaproteobacteria bacterium]